MNRHSSKVYFRPSRLKINSQWGLLDHMHLQHHMHRLHHMNPESRMNLQDQ
jgi:hypothetical protein